MKKDSKIYIAGHRGMVGSALWRKLDAAGYTHLIGRTHEELDLTRQDAVETFFTEEKPDYVVLAAAKVGGILANDTYPAEFIYDNLAVQTHTIHAAWQSGVRRLLFLGSSCIYPRNCPQPMKEDDLMTGPLEQTNQSYAMAKIAGISQCQAYNRQYGTRFLSVMPTNLYGPNDNYDLQTSHAMPALIRKFHLAKTAVEKDLEMIHRDESVYGPIPEEIKEALCLQHPASSIQHPVPKVVLWGTGSPFREFLHADDMADAGLFLMGLTDERFDSLLNGKIGNGAEETRGECEHYPVPLINIGCGEDQTLRELASLVADVLGFKGDVVWDTSKPDGTPRKLLDTSKLTALGWKPKISLKDGIRRTYEAYLDKLISY